MSHPKLLEARFDSYKIDKVIGTGTLGTVYEAQQVRLNRKVAGKFIGTAFVSEFPIEEFEEEVFDLAGLYHPNIAMVIDAGSVRGQPYIVTELIEGMTLEEFMESGEPDPVATIGIVSQICEGLAYAHDHGVLHLDLTPNHILLSEIGWVKLVDFRMSRPFTPSESAEGAGILPFLSPEELEYDATVDHRSDVYAVGKILWLLITGEMPPAHREGELSLDSLPEAWAPLIGKAVRRDPEERFESCEAFRAELLEMA